MIAILSAWALLLLLSLPLGCVGLRIARVRSIDRPGDRFLLAVWLGLLSLQLVLLTLSLFGPVTPWSGLALSACALAAFVWGRSVRHDILSFARGVTVPAGCAIALLAVLTAYACTQPICNRDVISYHADTIHWLSRIGVKPGLALVNVRFGFLVSWFMVPAMFNHGMLTARMTGVANGFAFLLLLGHLALAAWRILRGAGRPVDWFALAALSMASFFPIFLNDPISSTGDFANMLVTVIVAWSALLIYRPLPPAAYPEARRPLRDEHLVPLYLAACLLTIKLTTAPVLGSMGLLYLLYHRFDIKAWMVSGTIAAGVMLPQTVAVTLLTGYPFYPFRGLRFDLPWTLGWHYYLEKARWGVIPGYVDANYLSWSWLVNWLRLDATCVVAFVFFLAGMVALAGIVVCHRRRWREVLPCLLIGVTGIALLIAKSPFARFGWGYLSMLPAALVMLNSAACDRIVARMPVVLRGPRAAWATPVAGLAILVLVVSVLGQTESEKRMRRAVREGRITCDRPCQLLWPSRLPLVEYDDVARTVRAPVPMPPPRPSDPLHGPRPMFYPLVPRDGIAYRKPGLGVRGGFVHALPSGPGDGKRPDEAALRITPLRHDALPPGGSSCRTPTGADGL